AQCAPGEPIPYRLLVRAAGRDPDAESDVVQAEGGLARLGSLGLLERLPDNRLRLHQLLAAYAQDRAPDPAADAAAVERALVAELWPTKEAGYRRPPPVALYLAHARQVAEQATLRGDAAVALLFSVLG